MLQRVTSREVTRRNLILAISTLRASSSVQSPDAAHETLALQDPSFHRCSYRNTLCNHVNFQCSFLPIDAGKFSRVHERGSDPSPVLDSNGRRKFSSTAAEETADQSAAAEEVTDQTYPPAEETMDQTFEPPSNALQAYFKIIQVSEVFETQPWGQDTVKHLEDLVVSFTSDMVVRVIRAASSSMSCLGFFNWLTLKGFSQDASTYGAVLDSLGRAGAIEDMKRLTEEMRTGALVLDSGLYDRILHWCKSHGDTANGAFFLEKMKEEGIAMSASAYASMFSLHVREGKYEEAVTLYLQMIEEAVFPSSDTLALFIRCLLEAGKLDLAQKIFTSLSSLKVKPLPSMYAHMMAAYAEVGNPSMLQRLGKEMRKSCGMPGEVFHAAFKSLQKVGKLEEADAFAKEVWPELSLEERRVKAQDMGSVSNLDEGGEIDIQSDVEHLVCADRKAHVSLSHTVSLLESEGFSLLEHLKFVWTADSVHKALRRFDSSAGAWEFFKWLNSIPGFTHELKNEVYMLRILIKGLIFPAFKELLSDLQSKKRNLSLETFNVLIVDCAVAKNARVAMWVYSHLKESNLEADEESFSALVQAFARGRNPDKASDLCSVMQDVGIKPDVETYTAVIHSLGLAGRSDDAWSVYQRMLAVGLKPNVNTYTALLNMMNMVGDTDFAIKIFKDMNDNGVSPTEATQGIMSGIYEAAGNTTEAQSLDTQRKFLSFKKKEAASHQIYEALLEGLVEQERSPAFACVMR